ncbi:MAG: NUDIX hydrolase [Candidatus Riflebacteria bacterium]|nr:NUDIX hydrolase [Candidatus Riflebacteria bacterium]
MSFIYEYPRPSGTLDAALISLADVKPMIMLIKRGHDPFAGQWALPGGFLEMDEEPVDGAMRELAEETCLTGIVLRPLFACGQTGRDPRGRTLTMVFGALVDPIRCGEAKGSDDAAEASWHFLDAPPPMAFDHGRVLRQIASHLRWQASTALIGSCLLGPETSEDALIQLHRRALGKHEIESPLDRGIRLGLLERGSAKGLWRFVSSSEPGPDWSPLVW